MKVKEFKPEELPYAEACDLVSYANFLLKIQSAQLYGLMTGDPENINQELCIETIEKGKRMGIKPDENFIDWSMFRDRTKQELKIIEEDKYGREMMERLYKRRGHRP